MGQKRRVKISTLTGVTFTVTMPNGRCSVVDMKKELPFPPEGQVLVYKGKSLSDSMTLDQLGFEGGERCILFYDKKQANAARPTPPEPAKHFRRAVTTSFVAPNPLAVPPENENPPPSREARLALLQLRNRRPPQSLEGLKRSHPTSDSGSDSGDWHIQFVDAEDGNIRSRRRIEAGVRGGRTASSRPHALTLDAIVRPPPMPEPSAGDIFESRRPTSTAVSRPPLRPSRVAPPRMPSRPPPNLPALFSPFPTSNSSQPSPSLTFRSTPASLSTPTSVSSISYPSPSTASASTSFASPLALASAGSSPTSITSSSTSFTSSLALSAVSPSPLSAPSTSISSRSLDAIRPGRAIARPSVPSSSSRPRFRYFSDAAFPSMEFPDLGEESKQVTQLMNEIEAFENRQPTSSLIPTPDPFPMDSSSSSEDEHQEQDSGQPRAITINYEGSDDDDARGLRSRHRPELVLFDEEGVSTPGFRASNEDSSQFLFLRRLQREQLLPRAQPRPLPDFSEQLSQLEVMGFSRPLATQALRLNRNNLERSIEWLTQQ